MSLDPSWSPASLAEAARRQASARQPHRELPPALRPAPTRARRAGANRPGSLHLGASALARRRVALGLTQSDLAGRVGCDPSAVTRLEAGVRRPSLDLVPRLARALAVPIETVVGWFVALDASAEAVA